MVQSPSLDYYEQEEPSGPLADMVNKIENMQRILLIYLYVKSIFFYNRRKMVVT